MMNNQYKTIDAADIDYLRSVCGTERVIAGKDVNEDYCHDELAGIYCRPDALVKPQSTAEVSAVMKYAFAQNIPVTPRGQGTGLVGGSVPVFGGVMLDMSGMNRILELDEDNLTLTLEPGVLLMEISKFVEDRGLFYPPDPGEKTATIGGNISTNAGGMRAVKYGVTRDYVRGLEVVLADAENGMPDEKIRTVNCEIVKNRGGYTGSFAVRYNLPTQDMVEESGAGIVGAVRDYNERNDDEPF